MRQPPRPAARALRGKPPPDAPFNAQTLRGKIDPSQGLLYTDALKPEPGSLRSASYLASSVSLYLPGVMSTYFSNEKFRYFDSPFLNVRSAGLPLQFELMLTSVPYTLTP